MKIKERESPFDNKETPIMGKKSRRKPSLASLVEHLKNVLSNIGSTNPNSLKTLDLPSIFKRFKVTAAEKKIIVLARLYGQIPEPSALRPFILKYVANLPTNQGGRHKSNFLLRLLEAMRNQHQFVTDDFLDSVIPLVPRPPKPPQKGVKRIVSPTNPDKKPPS